MDKSERGDRQPYHHGDLRRALLIAAEEELAEKGVEGFTLRGCAKRAGVSHAAPAHHFKDVAGLLSALAAEGFERFLAAMERRAAAAGTDPLKRLIGSGLGYIDFAVGNPALFRLMFSSRKPDTGDAHLVEVATASFAHLVDSVASIAGAPPLDTIEGRRQVAAIWAMAHGLADLVLSGRMRFLEDNPQGLEADLTAILAKVIVR